MHILTTVDEGVCKYGKMNMHHFRSTDLRHTFSIFTCHFKLKDWKEEKKKKEKPNNPLTGSLQLSLLFFIRQHVLTV